MGRKIFVSYKHSDNNVQPLSGNYEPTARGYVDYLINNRLYDEIYKGEGNEDLSEFKDETIKDELKDKIYDSSVTLVLISPNMKTSEPESEQWIPWEISYSLKEITRGGQTSRTNAVIAVVLPDRNGSYEYCIKEREHNFVCECKNLEENNLFQILSDNMFYIKEPSDDYLNKCFDKGSRSRSCYILSVKWQDFIDDKDKYLNRAIKIKDNREAYNIIKEVKG